METALGPGSSLAQQRPFLISNPLHRQRSICVFPSPFHLPLPLPTPPRQARICPGNIWKDSIVFFGDKECEPRVFEKVFERGRRRESRYYLAKHD